MTLNHGSYFIQVIIIFRQYRIQCNLFYLYLLFCVIDYDLTTKILFSLYLLYEIFFLRSNTFLIHSTFVM